MPPYLNLKRALPSRLFQYIHVVCESLFGLKLVKINEFWRKYILSNTRSSFKMSECDFNFKFAQTIKVYRYPIIVESDLMQHRNKERGFFLIFLSFFLQCRVGSLPTGSRQILIKPQKKICFRTNFIKLINSPNIPISSNKKQARQNDVKSELLYSQIRIPIG